MKIEKMTKMRSGKYKIEFDSHEKIIVYDDIILKHNLLYHSIWYTNVFFVLIERGQQLKWMVIA